MCKSIVLAVQYTKNYLVLTLATGALTAVNYWQDQGLILTTFTLQAEEVNRLFWVQTVTTTVTDRLEVWLLSEDIMMKKHE